MANSGTMRRSDTVRCSDVVYGRSDRTHPISFTRISFTRIVCKAFYLAHHFSSAIISFCVCVDSLVGSEIDNPLCSNGKATWNAHEAVRRGAIRCGTIEGWRKPAAADFFALVL